MHWFELAIRLLPLYRLVQLLDGLAAHSSIAIYS